MKIVHLCNYFQPQLGYQEYFLAKEHSRMGHDVFVVTGDKYFPFPDYEQTVGRILGDRFVGSGVSRLDGFTIMRLKSMFEFSKRVWLKKLEKTIIGIQPDVVLCHGMASFNSLRIIDLKKRYGFRLIYDDHMLFAVGNKSLLAKLFYRFYNFKKIRRNADKLVGITEETREFIETNYLFPKDEVEMIPLGADTELFKFNEQLRFGFRKTYGICNDTVVITYTGKITERKAPHRIFLALEKIHSEIYSDIAVVFVGDIEGSYQETFLSYRQVASELFHIVQIPMMKNSDLPAVYSGSDFAVWPAEPTASMIEASCCSLPIIGCDYLEERYKNNSGIGIKPGDVDELSAAMLRLINDKDLRLQMGRNGRTLVESELSWNIIAKRFLDME